MPGVLAAVMTAALSIVSFRHFKPQTKVALQQLQLAELAPSFWMQATIIAEVMPRLQQPLSHDFMEAEFSLALPPIHEALLGRRCFQATAPHLLRRPHRKVLRHIVDLIETEESAVVTLTICPGNGQATQYYPSSWVGKRFQ